MHLVYYILFWFCPHLTPGSSSVVSIFGVFPCLCAWQVCAFLGFFLVQFFHFINNLGLQLSATLKFSFRAGTTIRYILCKAANVDNVYVFIFVLLPLQQQCIKALFGKASWACFHVWHWALILVLLLLKTPYPLSAPNLLCYYIWVTKMYSNYWTSP